MKYAVLLFAVLSVGCLRKGLDVDVNIGLDPCVTTYPECTPDGGAVCIDFEGAERGECHPACLFGLEPLMGCPLDGQCYNVAAGTDIETPVICTSF